MLTAINRPNPANSKDIQYLNVNKIIRFRFHPESTSEFPYHFCFGSCAKNKHHKYKFSRFLDNSVRALYACLRRIFSEHEIQGIEKNSSGAEKLYQLSWIHW